MSALFELFWHWSRLATTIIITIWQCCYNVLKLFKADTTLKLIDLRQTSYFPLNANERKTSSWRVGQKRLHGTRVHNTNDQRCSSSDPAWLTFPSTFKLLSVSQSEYCSCTWKYCKSRWMRDQLEGLRQLSKKGLHCTHRGRHNTWSAHSCNSPRLPAWLIMWKGHLHNLLYMMYVYFGNTFSSTQRESCSYTCTVKASCGLRVRKIIANCFDQ